MRFLFLDCDGVLNDHAFDEAAQSCTLLGRCVHELNRIVAEVPRLGVVLTSAWRYMVLRKAMTRRGFLYLLQTHGVRADFPLLGTTVADETVPTRGGQVRRWLDTHEGRSVWECESFAVLDDAPPGMDFAPVADRLVKTDGQVGLTAADASRVIAMLLEGTNAQA